MRFRILRLIAVLFFMNEGITRQKSYTFALRVVKLHLFLSETEKEYVLSKQLLRCGTAIGAMVCEAEQAESKADFVHKLAISNKEANEMHYWISLLRDSELMDEKLANSLLVNCEELQKLLISSIKTAKNSIRLKL